MDLDDKNPCTLDTCEKGQVEHIALSGGQCDDGNECTIDDFCHLSTCTGGPLIECVKPGCASSVSCVQGEGCVPVWMPGGSPCNDNRACTEGDICNANHSCVGTSDALCDDGNPCTADSCDTLTDACRHLAVDGVCDDGDPCTDTSACTNGECVGTPKDCGDNNICTDDTCDPESGDCLWEPTNASCEDGNKCTLRGTAWRWCPIATTVTPAPWAHVT